MKGKILISVLASLFLIIQTIASPTQHRQHHAHRQEGGAIALRLNNSTTEGIAPGMKLEEGPGDATASPLLNETEGMRPGNETGGGPWRRYGRPPLNETE
eukprot:CAMPEP_0113962568 /NCGR_PEP_ID=MMETSP0011_2-20120614/5995_1 /TAXON_ID=101924 /ORGANISM="Rhodosorus marinus" /LENGTH=99 /DNA_ID=CAMNT_0000974451 /DNA_START=70 /DNA_END=367 /DNA_ORIENTATION=+ /assembly_acc=CAM_ASM_000156